MNVKGDWVHDIHYLQHKICGTMLNDMMPKIGGIFYDRIFKITTSRNRAVLNTCYSKPVFIRGTGHKKKKHVSAKKKQDTTSVSLH
jgi:hypothetical protein